MGYFTMNVNSEVTAESMQITCQSPSTVRTVYGNIRAN